ncbi:polysaccharide deacetylase family protein [Lewinella sp. IMCC34191]|uniref:polysaccharide deacetylase family protein n=1 Tax=Lewinella sp. IMCC34191 TaxID=2259172 RepID=UPI001300A346|nr:polysaccharide deacetylase family protein [Lewinella sp. IMCC34191]
MSSPPEITIQTAIRHPRLRYVLRVVGDCLGYRFRFFNDRSVFGHTETRYLITYGESGRHNFPAHPLLSGKPYDFSREGDDFKHSPDGGVTICQTPEGPDLLAAIFFCLSRYEEYQDFTPDAYDRFSASESHAYRLGYLDRPVVREWTAAIGRRLVEWFPDLPAPTTHPFEFRPTYDIDLLWAYHYRGWRGFASGVRDLLSGHLARGLARFTVKAAEDPYQTLPFLENLHREFGLKPTYFWLLSSRLINHDTNPFPIPPAQKEWMVRLSRTSTTGIHPSYASNDQPALVEVEKQRLESIIGRPVSDSRQHFLKLRMPETYRKLLNNGIRSDHTMGYGDAVGWRAGTNLPFPWYDLDVEKETRLTVHPFAAMDVTLCKYLDLTPPQAEATVQKLATALEPYGGPFILLWHNSSFSPAYGWAGWRAMYERLVAYLSAK